MSWSTELVTQLRYVINDLDSSNYTWTDVQLQNFIGISAVTVGQELQNWGFPSFSFTSGSSPTLTPDPTDDDYSDFVGILIIIKAACIISNAEMKKTAAQSGFTIVDDKSRIETKDRISSAKIAAEKFCGDYDLAVKAYIRGEAFVGGKDGIGILPPYSSISDWYINE